MFNKALIIGILLFGATFNISANEVQKWEYKCDETNRDIARSLSDIQTPAEYVEYKFNKLGEEGWEMVGYAMNDGNNARMVCFKRPKKS
jgi:hypothetical protein